MGAGRRLAPPLGGAEPKAVAPGQPVPERGREVACGVRCPAVTAGTGGLWRADLAGIGVGAGLGDARRGRRKAGVLLPWERAGAPDGGGRCPRGQGGKGAMRPGVGLEEGGGAAPREWAGALSVCGALPAGTGGGWAVLLAGVGEGRGRRGGLCGELESETFGGAGFAGNWKVKHAAGRARRLPGRAGAQQRGARQRLVLCRSGAAAGARDAARRQGGVTGPSDGGCRREALVPSAPSCRERWGLPGECGAEGWGKPGGWCWCRGTHSFPARIC